MKKEKYLEVVSSRPVPGKEKQYREWYHQHITDMFEFGGLKKVSLNKLYQAVGEKGKESPTYVTIYEFGSRKDLDDFYKKLMVPLQKGGKMPPMPDSVDLIWAGYYEPVETLEK